MEKTVVLGMMAEIVMKAKILKQKLKDDPNSVVEVLRRIDLLEDEMLSCLEEFQRPGTR